MTRDGRGIYRRGIDIIFFRDRSPFGFFEFFRTVNDGWAYSGTLYARKTLVAIRTRIAGVFFFVFKIYLTHCVREPIIRIDR